MAKPETTPGRCPFHADTEDTIRLFHDGSFECLRCGWHGDAAMRLMADEGLSWEGAAKRLNQNPKGPTNG
jgi:hypothetical protein